MSYQLSITRNTAEPALADSNSATSQHEISPAEWLTMLESDDLMSFIVDEGDTVSALFQATQSPEQAAHVEPLCEEIIFRNGRVFVNQPSDQLIQKMMALARLLNARLVSTSKGSTDLICEGTTIRATADRQSLASHRMMIIP